MNDQFGLMLGNSVIGNGVVGNYSSELSAQSPKWSRSVRNGIGFADGTITLMGNYANLQHIFYHQLGAHIEEYESTATGVMTTWEGYVSEAILSGGNIQRRRAYENVLNRVSVTHLGGSFVVDSIDSQARYGVKETALDMANFSLSDATAMANRWLSGHTDAPIEAVGRDRTAHLELRVSGYWATGNNRQVSHAFPSGTSISDAIKFIVSNYCEFLIVGDVHDDGRLVEGAVSGGAWDVIAQLAQNGGNGNDVWALSVEAGRRVCYRAVEVEPIYYLSADGNWNLRGGTSAHVSPRKVLPGVVRDMSYPIGHRGVGMLLDGRDFFADEIRVNENGLLDFRTASLTEANLMEFA
jgi:hypothetical protein